MSRDAQSTDGRLRLRPVATSALALNYTDVGTLDAPLGGDPLLAAALRAARLPALAGPQRLVVANFANDPSRPRIVIQAGGRAGSEEEHGQEQGHRHHHHVLDGDPIPAFITVLLVFTSTLLAFRLIRELFVQSLRQRRNDEEQAAFMPANQGGVPGIVTVELPGMRSFVPFRGTSHHLISPGETVVIGITGCSRCGKGWVSKELLRAVEAAGKKATIIGQDEFWFQTCQVNVHGHVRTSEEEPECTDHEKFAAAIKEKANTHDVVIAEGFHLVHHRKVTGLLNHIFLIELDKDEARRRRTQPRDATVNPNPLQPRDFDDLLWPAHERYMKDKVAPLGARVVQLRSPANTAQRDELVDRIMHAAGLMQDTSGNAAASASRAAPESAPAGSSRDPETERDG